MLLSAVGALLAAAATVTPAPTTPAPATPTPSELTIVRDTRIIESSGLAASPVHPGLVWMVNDSGSAALVYGVELATGRTQAVLRLVDAQSREVQARDIEAMTAALGTDGRGLLWLADVGDNRGVRESVVLRLIREPSPAASANRTPVSVRVRYPDGPHDVETIIATPDGRLLLVSKQLFGAVVYQVPAAAVAAAVAGRSTSKPVVAVPVAGVAQSLVTDGAGLPDGRIVLRSYDGAAIYPAPPTRATAAEQLEPLQQVVLPGQPQGETMTVVDEGTALIVGSEGVRQPLWRVPLPAAAPAPTSSTPASSSTQPAGNPPSTAKPTVSRGLLVSGGPVLGLIVVAAAVAFTIRRRK